MFPLSRGTSTVFLCLLLLAGCGARQPNTGGLGPATGAGRPSALVRLDDTLCRETATGKVWLLAQSPRFTSWQEANRYVAALNAGGHSDWRLPSREELRILHEIRQWGRNGGCELGRPEQDLWSGATVVESSLGHWETYLLCAPETKYCPAKSKTGRVRAVRP